MLAPVPASQQHALAPRAAYGHPQHQRRSQRAAPPPPPLVLPRRRLLSIAAPLLFLPWRGCDEGGSYSIGVTENCQQMYQPAAAAERR